MNADESSLLWKQLDALHRAVSDLIELERAALSAQRPPGASEPRARDSSRATDAILGRLDELRERLAPLRQEAAGHAACREAGERPRFEEIDVARINVVEPDGTPRMVLSSRASAPDPVLDGKVLGQRQTGNQAGLIFYNDEGVECGGLRFGGKRENDRYSAEAGLMFDQFRQDEAVKLEYEDVNGRRTGGLRVLDRPDIPLRELAERCEAIQRMPEGPGKAEALEQMRAAGMFSATRVFVGRNRDGEAVVNLYDRDERLRLRLAVDSAGVPRLEFLDEAGHVIYGLPDFPRRES